jgi:hypothetical protein
MGLFLAFLSDEYCRCIFKRIGYICDGVNERTVSDLGDIRDLTIKRAVFYLQNDIEYVGSTSSPWHKYDDEDHCIVISQMNQDGIREEFKIVNREVLLCLHEMAFKFRNISPMLHVGNLNFKSIFVPEDIPKSWIQFHEHLQKTGRIPVSYPYGKMFVKL